jgi:curved DNA-binding protein CbpA
VADRKTGKAKSHYDTLGVLKSATTEQIKRAFRKRASKAHPDKGGDSADMAAVNAAWACLGNPQKRLTYDQTGQDEALGPDAETRGKGLFMELMDRALASGSAVGLLRKVRDDLQKLRGAVSVNMQQAKIGIRRLESSRDAVRKKKKKKPTAAEANLYQLLIDARISVAEHQIAACSERLADVEEALKFLDEYEEDDADNSPLSLGPDFYTVVSDMLPKRTA